MHGRASLITAIETLSRPGALSDGKDSTTLRTCPHDTGWKKELIKRHRNNTSSAMGGASTGRSCSAARRLRCFWGIGTNRCEECIEIISQSLYVLRIYWLCDFSTRQTPPNDFPQRVVTAVVISNFSLYVCFFSIPKHVLYFITLQVKIIPINGQLCRTGNLMQFNPNPHLVFYFPDSLACVAGVKRGGRGKGRKTRDWGLGRENGHCRYLIFMILIGACLTNTLPKLTSKCSTFPLTSPISEFSYHGTWSRSSTKSWASQCL